MRWSRAEPILEHMAETSDLVSDTALDPIGAVAAHPGGPGSHRTDARGHPAARRDPRRHGARAERRRGLRPGRAGPCRVVPGAPVRDRPRRAGASCSTASTSDKAIPVIRAFTHFALLANVAEDIHRERRRAVHVACGRAAAEQQPGRHLPEARRRGPGRRHGRRRADRCAGVTGHHRASHRDASAHRVRHPAPDHRADAAARRTARPAPTTVATSSASCAATSSRCGRPR